MVIVGKPRLIYGYFSTNTCGISVVKTMFSICKGESTQSLKQRVSNYLNYLFLLLLLHSLCLMIFRYRNKDYILLLSDVNKDRLTCYT